MLHNKRDTVKYKQIINQNEVNTVSVATDVENTDGTSQVENQNIPTSITIIDGENNRPGLNSLIAVQENSATPVTLANKTGEAIYLGFKCDVNDGCTTSTYDRKVDTPDECASACLQQGTNAGSYISLNSNSCRNTDPFLPGNISFYPENTLGSCICYNNAKYTPDDYINETFIDDYNIFRIG